MRRDKVILTDVDGVLLDWQYHFEQWMNKHEYVLVNPDVYSIMEAYDLQPLEKKRLTRMFNESATIRKLSPLRDAVKYVKKLHEEHGYIFHVISSLSTDEYAQHLRTKNLRELFGNGVFDQFIYLDTGADKDEVLEAYRDTECYWIEDKPENADVGWDLGLDSILMSHSHNSDYNGEAKVVNNWKEIYDIIVGE